MSRCLSHWLALTRNPEHAFRRAYQSFQINVPERIDVETFLGETRGCVTNLMTKELQGLDLANVQMTAWIRFKVEVEDGDGKIIRVGTADKAFSSWMTEVFQGSNLDEIIDEMFAHMRM